MSPKPNEPPLTPAEKQILQRMAERSDHVGAGQRASARHEFDHAFPELLVAINRPLPHQIKHHVAMLADLDAWLQDQANGVQRAAGMNVMGPTGRGKTVLATLVAKEAASVAGVTPSFISCREIRRNLRGLPSERKRGYDDYIDAADPHRFPLLVLDDWGFEAGNAEAVDLVNDIVDLRQSAACYTLATSNKDVAGLEKHLADDRAISRSKVLRPLIIHDVPHLRRPA